MRLGRLACFVALVLQMTVASAIAPDVRVRRPGRAGAARSRRHHRRHLGAHHPPDLRRPGEVQGRDHRSRALAGPVVGGLARRQGLDVHAAPQREVSRRHALRRQGRGVELRALVEDHASAARQPGQGRTDLRVLGGAVRRLRRQVDRDQGRGDRLAHDARHAQGSAGAVPGEPRHVHLRHREPGRRGEVGHGVRQASGGHRGLQARRVEAEPGSRAGGEPRLLGREAQGQAGGRAQHQGQLAAAGRAQGR